jgi:outer membrane receptor protein involved in Fe transport
MSAGELLFNGTAQNAYKNDLALSGQMDGVWRVSHAHTIRFGFYVQHDHAISRTGTYAFPVDDSGAQTGQPIDILDDSASNAWTTSAYLQDEWKLGEGITLNYGGRFDRYAAYRTESQFSPRVNMVWEPATRTAIHLGYARYFSPPPFELVGGADLGKLAGTSAAAGNTLDTTPYAERQHYFDIGFEQKIKGGFSLGVDAYYRLSTNLIDEGQFGAPIIQTPSTTPRVASGAWSSTPATIMVRGRSMATSPWPRRRARASAPASSTSARRSWPISPITTSISITTRPTPARRV